MIRPRIIVTRLIPSQGLDLVQSLTADDDIDVWDAPLPPAYGVRVMSQVRLWRELSTRRN